MGVENVGICRLHRVTLCKYEVWIYMYTKAPPPLARGGAFAELRLILGLALPCSRYFSEAMELASFGHTRFGLN